MEKLRELYEIIREIERSDREKEKISHGMAKLSSSVQVLQLNIDSRDSFPGDERFLFAEKVSVTDVLYWLLFCTARRGYKMEQILEDLERKLVHLERQSNIRVMQPTVINTDNTVSDEPKATD